MDPNRQEYCISLQEAGKRIGVGRSHIYALANSKGFPCVRLGKRIVVPVDALKRWLEEQAGNVR